MLRSILTFLDGFIPAKKSPPQVKVRLRLVAVYYLISSVSLSLYLILGIALNFLHSSFSSILAFALFVNILAIVLIRRSYPVDKVVVSNICLRLIITTVDFLMFSKMLLPGWIGIFTLNLLLVFLLFPEKGIRFFMLAFTLVSQLAGFSLAPRFGISFARALSASPGALTSYLFFSEIAAVTMIFLYLKIREITARELDHEQEWQLRSLRISELTSITGIMVPLMRRPLHAFVRDWQAFEAAPTNSRDKELAKMDHDLDDLLRVSQSFSWIYRAYRRESGCAAQLATLVQQLEVLLSSKAVEKGWSVKTRSMEQNVEIFGPIPSIMLLLFSTVVQVLESAQPEALRHLELSVDKEGHAVRWIVSWPDSPQGTGRQSLDWEGQFMRHDLLQDLKKDCLATIDDYEEKGQHYLRISGAWLSRTL